MKIETIKERISKAEETISKKENTISKKAKSIEKKASYLKNTYGIQDWKSFDKYNRTGWTPEEHNDIYWTICGLEGYEDDIIRLQDQIEEAKERFQKYQEMLQEEIEKANSRDVKIIMEFLERWKTRNIEFFLEQKVKYEEATIVFNNNRNFLYDEMKFLGYSASWNKNDPNHEKYEELHEELQALRKAHRENWLHVTQFDHGSKDWETTMREDLELEKNRKYDDLIARTNKIVGQITDASRLKINAKGNLDGFITGTKGTAKVETIGAGGYNIQCFHFRTLIHEVK